MIHDRVLIINSCNLNKSSGTKGILKVKDYSAKIISFSIFSFIFWWIKIGPKIMEWWTLGTCQQLLTLKIFKVFHSLWNIFEEQKLIYLFVRRGDPPLKRWRSQNRLDWTDKSPGISDNFYMNLDPRKCAQNADLHFN